jgi:hypothetical protein
MIDRARRSLQTVTDCDGHGIIDHHKPHGRPIGNVVEEAITSYRFWGSDMCCFSNFVSGKAILPFEWGAPPMTDCDKHSHETEVKYETRGNLEYLSSFLFPHSLKQ